MRNKRVRSITLKLTEGLRVVGTAGDDKKIDYLLKELEFDGAFNYKKESPAKALPSLCPDRIGMIPYTSNSRYLLGKCWGRDS